MAGIILMALAVLAIPVAVIYLLVAVSGLKDRVDLVERRIHELEAALKLLRGGAPEAAAPPMAIANADETAVQEVAPKVPPSEVLVPETLDPETLPSHQPTQLPLPEEESRFFNWLRENWVYVVSAASLGLAGIFLVQYGIENGILPPWLRVLSGVGFGLGLIGAGEWMRRRGGDEEGASTAFLPSVFAGAGLVAIFAATLAARQIYGLIGPATAFAGHLVTAAGAVALGWFYGPLLAGVGLIGAALAPFIVAGGSAPTGWLYGYFALIPAVGLAVDAVRRWVWVSRLALGLGYGGGILICMAGAGNAGFILMMLGMAVLATVLPVLALVPRHAGPSALQAVLAKALPSREVMLALLAVTLSSLGILSFTTGASGEALLAFGALMILALAFLLWAEAAEGLADLAIVPALAFLAGLLIVGMSFAPLRALYQLPAEGMAAPMTVSWLLAMAGAISGGFALRSFRPEALQRLHVLAAVLVAAVAAAVLEMLWQPSEVIGPYVWALQVKALAAAMVALALRYGRMADRRPLAYATLSALSLMALSLFLVASSVGLTLALAVLLVAAAGLDRRFDLPEMGWFIQAAVAVLGYRLLADPGLKWAFEAVLGPVILGFGGAIAALVTAIWLLRDLPRALPKGVMESAAAGLAAILANVLISRVILGADAAKDGASFTHWGASLNALPWLVLMLMQIYRANLGGPLRRLRQAIGGIAGAMAGMGMLGAVFAFNPLFSSDPQDANGWVRGPLIFDSLLLAYALPAAILLVAAWRIAVPRLRLAMRGIGAGLLVLYVGLEIRRIFQGDYLGGGGVTQGELYSYTLAMMLLGAGLLYQAIAKRSDDLRRIAMAVIALTVAKMFFLDAAGLTGLTRVFSFLGLGLSLAGLAWLNRWAGRVSEQDRRA